MRFFYIGTILINNKIIKEKIIYLNNINNIRIIIMINKGLLLWNFLREEYKGL